DEVARFLGGRAPVEIVAPPASKTFDLKVTVAVSDMRNPPATAAEPEVASSLWPHVEDAILDRILEHRSTIVFANSRRLAERLTGRLNELYAKRLGLDLPAPAVPAAMIAQSGSTAGAEPILAKAHHGSVSKE